MKDTPYLETPMSEDVVEALQSVHTAYISGCNARVDRLKALRDECHDDPALAASITKSIEEMQRQIKEAVDNADWLQ